MKAISIVFIFLFSFASLPLLASNGMEETMFASGKIYTFLAVAFIVLLGIFAYLFRLDKRLDRIEKESKNA